MELAYKVLEPYGFEQVFIDGELPVDCTMIAPPEQSWKPVFNFRTQKWKETALKSEKEQTPEDDPNEITQLKNENKELKEQVSELTDAVLFISENMGGTK